MTVVNSSGGRNTRFRTALVVFVPAVIILAGWHAGSTHAAESLMEGFGFQESSTASHWTEDHPGTVEGWNTRWWTRWQAEPWFAETRYGVEADYDPPKGAYSAAIVWMTSHGRLRDTLASMESLARYMPMLQPYSLVLLHEGDLLGSVQDAVVESWLKRAHEVELGGELALAKKMRKMIKYIEYPEVNMAVPDSLAVKMVENGYPGIVIPERWPGYHSMCRFFSVNIFWHHRIRQFDYILRFDSDSFLVTPMKEDPFRRLQRLGGRFAFRHQTRDENFVTVGMWQFIQDYVNSHLHYDGLAQRVEDTRLIKEVTEDHQKGLASYYTNFEMIHVPSFRRPDVADWLNNLRGNEDGFYRHRWGDAPLHYATVNMWFNQSEIIKFDDFAYFHQGMFNEGT